MIEASLYTYLTTKRPALNAILSGRVYSIRAPSSKELGPYLTFLKISGVYVQNLDERSGTARVRFQVDLWSPSSEQARSMFLALQGVQGEADAPDQFSGQLGDHWIEWMELGEDSERPQPDPHGSEKMLHRVQCDLTIAYHE